MSNVYGTCNKEGHTIKDGECMTCLKIDYVYDGKEPDYAEITRATLDYVEWKNKNKKNKFTKADSNKPNLAILFDTGKALEQVANVMSYGAEKYSRENWKECDDTERYVSATLRHLMAYCRDEKLDSESGMNHLAHAVCSLLFLLELDD